VKRCHGEDTLGVALRENSSMPSLFLEKEVVKTLFSLPLFCSIMLGYFMGSSFYMSLLQDKAL
jgi:hypothetical protein